MKRMPIAGPWITDHEIAAVTRCVTEDWYEHANHSIMAFEQAFAAYSQRLHAVSLPSCTSALHLSMAALGVGPGDEIIVPDLTWIASSAPISYMGAKPVFVDVDKDSWCIDADSIEKAITSRTKAILVVELYGSMPDWTRITEIAQANGLFIIEDSAEALGSRYQDRPAGNFGDVSVFSFHGSKTLTTGEGGMLVTDHSKLYHRVLKLRDHGRNPGDTEFFNQEVAYKYKMSSLQAALGLAQLQRVAELVNKKRQIFSWYQQGLKDIADIRLNAQAFDVFNSYWMSTLVLGDSYSFGSQVLRNYLLEKNIDTRPFFHPLSKLPAYADYESSKTAISRNKTAYHISPKGLNLPSALRLEEPDIMKVCREIKDFFSAHSTVCR